MVIDFHCLLTAAYNVSTFWIGIHVDAYAVSFTYLVVQDLSSGCVVDAYCAIALYGEYTIEICHTLTIARHTTDACLHILEAEILDGSSLK